jgi:hypothetical protein
MKTPILTLLTGVFLSGLFSSVGRADVVYNNSTNDLGIRFNIGTAEVGDEIVLAGTARLITNFVFQYWGENFSGNEAARVRFYANDGTNAPAGTNILVPKTLLYDSGTFSVPATPRSTLIFDQSTLGGGVWVPDSFTWSVQFFGIEDGESAGVDLYSPPTVGGNYLEFWENAGSFDWQYRSIVFNGTNVPANFGAFVEAVPEPSALSLAMLALAFGLSFWAGRRGDRCVFSRN